MFAVEVFTRQTDLETAVAIKVEVFVRHRFFDVDIQLIASVEDFFGLIVKVAGGSEKSSEWCFGVARTDGQDEAVDFVSNFSREF
jgi:hypothetical protein